MRAKTLFYCTSCGNEFPKWQGRCPACGNWNTIVEQPAESQKAASTARSGLGKKAVPQRLADVTTSEELRFSTGMSELDRVLGGGAVQGSLVLVGGAPGIGKSTLMLQICNELCKQYTVLYVSGEESTRQIKLRSQRLGVTGEPLYLLSETHLEDITDAVHQVRPNILIVDSIQT
ncbi:MAG: AAA family ATPase, partial [Clostridiales bacterium]|nr:AAA family ATPase [Clostridiales bacterium]